MQRKLLTNGNTFKRTDSRWGGVVWYADETGERKRKSFSGKTEKAVKNKITEFITNFNDEIELQNEANNCLYDGIKQYLQVFKFPSVERTTYDRNEQLLNNQIKPYLGDKVVSCITAVDIKGLINQLTSMRYSFSTVKQTYNLLNEYFRYLDRERIIPNNPMRSVEMLKKAKFLSQQGKEIQPTSETITVFTNEEIELFKKEAFKTWSNGNPYYQQPAAYILILNTGLRTAEALGLHNADIDLEKRVMYIRRGVKEVNKRNGYESKKGKEIEVGKLKTASSKRTVPLNDTAIEMIKLLQKEYYFGEDSPLICDEKGNYTKPSNFRKRFYRILKSAGIETKGIHSLRHTFATNLVNGVRLDDGTIRALSPKQVANLLGHSTSEITELYYVKKDDNLLGGLTDGFQL